MEAFVIWKWCKRMLGLEDFVLSSLQTAGASFAGAALFWIYICPNRRCCQMSTVRAAVEHRREGENNGR